MQAIRCSRCGLLTDPGDYGNAPFACAGLHFPVEVDGFAPPAESALSEWKPGIGICDGSEINSPVEEVTG